MRTGELRDVLVGPAITHPEAQMHLAGAGAIVNIVDITASDPEGPLVALLVGDDEYAMTVAELVRQLDDTAPRRQIVAEADNSILSSQIIVCGNTVTLTAED